MAQATEPYLTEADHRAWELLQKTAAAHAQTRGFARRVEVAKAVVSEALGLADAPVLMWSGGKDSTALTHLVRVEIGYDMPAISEKDDLDFPGEREYVEVLAAEWGLRLRVVTPTISPVAYLREHGPDLAAWSDLHSRRSGLSRACFYGVVEEAARERDLVFLGLRAEESRGRRMNHAVRGPIYATAAGRWTACPLASWTGLDVFAYCQTREVPLLPVYRCIGFHLGEPWAVRKSWWVPGESTQYGGVEWLRRYWPSLHRQLADLVPAVRAY